MVAVTHLAVARSQNTRSGILGLNTKERQSLWLLFLFISVKDSGVKRYVLNLVGQAAQIFICTYATVRK